jgi:hypothetical protein
VSDLQDSRHDQHRAEHSHGCEGRNDGHGDGNASGNDLHDAQREQPSPPMTE